MRPRTTVVIRGDRIVASGPPSRCAFPSGATVIDATGKTIMPGLWDMHGHMQLYSQSTGQRRCSSSYRPHDGSRSRRPTSTSRVASRSGASRDASPRRAPILAGFIEGPGKWAGPTPVIVRTEDEARALGRALRLDRLQADQALQPRASRPRADDRRRSAQARHAAERTHSARAERAGRGRARLRRGQSRRVPVLDVLSGFALRRRRCARTRSSRRRSRRTSTSTARR